MLLRYYLSGYKYFIKHLNVKSTRRNILRRLKSFIFALQRYVENVKQDASIGTNILRVSASDEDADNNGAIVYSLSSPNNEQNLEYFEIQPESGWIVLKKPLDVSIPIIISLISYISSLFSSIKQHRFPGTLPLFSWAKLAIFLCGFCASFFCSFDVSLRYTA